MKTVAVIVVRTDKVFSWLGHMPILNWSLGHSLPRCGARPDRLCGQYRARQVSCQELLAAEEISVHAIPPELVKKDDKHLDKWLTAANGPAADADIVVLCRPHRTVLASGQGRGLRQPGTAQPRRHDLHGPGVQRPHRRRAGQGLCRDLRGAGPPRRSRIHGHQAASGRSWSTPSSPWTLATPSIIGWQPRWSLTGRSRSSKAVLILPVPLASIRARGGVIKWWTV